MRFSTFLIQLGGTILLSIGLILLFHNLIQFASYQSISWIAILFSVCISIPMYFIGSWASQHKNKQLFTYIILFFLMFKMIAVVIIILTYQKVMLPVNNLFVIPFFSIYFLFTFFETYFLAKLGLNK